MSPLDVKRITEIMNGMTEEQQVLAVQCIPDEIVWNEIYSRFFEDRNDLVNIIKMARSAKLATSNCTPTNGYIDCIRKDRLWQDDTQTLA